MWRFAWPHQSCSGWNSYLPNNSCTGIGAAIVSDDNGITWNIRRVQNDTAKVFAANGLQDPAIGIDNNGRAYFVGASGNGQLITAEHLRLESLQFLGKGGSGSVHRMMITDGPFKGLFVAVKFL